MSAKKGLLARIFRTNSDSDCCKVKIVADDDDTTEKAHSDATTTDSGAPGNISTGSGTAGARAGSGGEHLG